MEAPSSSILPSTIIEYLQKIESANPLLTDKTFVYDRDLENSTTVKYHNIPHEFNADTLVPVAHGSEYPNEMFFARTFENDPHKSNKYLAELDRLCDELLGKKLKCSYSYAAGGFESYFCEVGFHYYGIEGLFLLVFKTEFQKD